MKLLLDQCLPRSAVGLLGKLGHDAVHTGDCGLATAPDAVILDFARQQGRTIVTLDSDFHSLIAVANALGPSVIRVRVPGLKAAPLTALLREVLSGCETELAHGALVSVTEDRVRVRNLPIKSRS